MEHWGNGNIEKAYSDTAIAVRSGKADTPAKVFAGLKAIFPDNARFLADFSQKIIGKAKLSRYILREVTIQRQKTKVQVVTDDEKKCTLEHIMPKTRSQDWLNAAKDEGEYLEHVNRLGNLTLIEREQNKAAANASFAKKKAEAFSKSELFITKDLCNYNDWTINEIATRQTELANWAVKIWSLPY